MFDIFDLGLGINDYAGRGDLNGCRNDAADGTAVEAARIADQILLLDKDVCPTNVEQAITMLHSRMQPLDWLRIRNSSHGTNVPDADGDDATGYDQAVVWWDNNGRDFFYATDDYMRSRIDSLRSDINVAVWTDSCNSGGYARADRNLLDFLGSEERIRYLDLPPEAFGFSRAPTRDLPINRRLFASVVSPQSDERPFAPKRIVWEGCETDEYSWDAKIAGRYNGAFTRTVINSYHALVQRAGTMLSYRTLHEQVRVTLPNRRYPQAPRLEGSPELFDAI